MTNRDMHLSGSISGGLPTALAMTTAGAFGGSASLTWQQSATDNIDSATPFNREIFKSSNDHAIKHSKDEFGDRWKDQLEAQHAAATHKASAIQKSYQLQNRAADDDAAVTLGKSGVLDKVSDGLGRRRDGAAPADDPNFNLQGP